MKKIYINGIVFTLSLVLGLLLISLYDSSKDILNDENLGERQVSLLREEINKAYTEKRELYDDINSLKTDIRNLEEKLERAEKNHEELMDELNSYKVLSGGFDIVGPGIIIDINDPEYVSEYFDNVSISNSYFYILEIISYLNSAGAEAISINDQRFTSYTEVVPVNNYLNVNGKRVIAPIEIKAIGDKRTLNSAINFPSGVLEQMKNIGFIIEVVESDEIEINALSNLKEFKFAMPYEYEEIEY